MKLGFFLCTQDPPRAERITEVWQENLHLCQVMDAEGLDLVGLGEHHFRDDGQMPAPLVAAAAIAARTSRIGIVTTVSVGTLWQPLRLAEEAAVVDVLSGGRFTLGLGLGNYEPELAAFGVAKRDQAKVFEEILDIVSAGLSGETVDYRGKHFTVPGVRITPAPVRKPLPIWLGGMSRPGVRRAARYGFPLLLDPLHTVAELQPWVAAYHAACEEFGTTPSVKLLRYGWVGSSVDEAERDWWPFMREQVWNYLVVVPRFAAEGSNALLRGATRAEELPMRAIAEDRFFLGDEKTVANEIRDMATRVGAEEVLVKMQGERGPWGPTIENAVRLLSGPVRGAL